jgi:hypothetical protein
MRTPNYRLGRWGNRRFNQPVTIHKPPRSSAVGPFCDPAITLQDENGDFLLDENGECLFDENGA